MTNWFVNVFGRNWKSNLIATVAMLGTIPAIITAITQFIKHQPVDWHAAAGGTLLALLAYATKDASNHTTIAEAAAAQAAVVGNPNAPAMMKAAEEQVKQAKKEL